LSSVPATGRKIQYAIRAANGPCAEQPDYGWRVDRAAIARSERRRQATEELEFERERTAALHDEIVRLVLELDGERFDEEVFARLSPDDVEVVRTALHGTPAVEEDEEWLELTGGDVEEPRDEQAEREELEAEIVRLQGEIAASTRRQEAFVRYLEALGE
jgi:hypothetical protein